jgi:hypothetical protein
MMEPGRHCLIFVRCKHECPLNTHRLPAAEARQLLKNFASLIELSQAQGVVMTRKVLRPVALIGTVVTMLTMVLMLSHTTISMSGVGVLKCYGTNGTEKAC